ncbi:MAG: FAD-dependent thymidylate synthase [Nanoarchaeota archaeon]|nr:FAD-dependent thymidylate synthase [Nanoarchaeota archaeon]
MKTEKFPKHVKLIAWVQNPKENWDAEDPASCGARGCFSESASSQIHKEEILRKDYEKRKEKIFQETSGRNHGAVLDQSFFIFSIDNLTRASTLLLCAPEYASHLQQSLRRATAERGFYLPNELKGTDAEKIMQEQFQLYATMQEAKIPSEDARFILPLYTKTTIQSAWNARELMHLDSIVDRFPILNETRDTIKQMVLSAKRVAPQLMEKRENNYEVLSWFPSSQLFANKNQSLEDYLERGGHSLVVSLIDSSKIKMNPKNIEKAVMEKDEVELANLKHYHFTFLVPMSIVTFHQATRQRTWNQSIESLPHAIRSGFYITPESIKETPFEEKYKQITEKSLEFIKTQRGNPELFGVLPHNLIIHDLIHINGWNAVYSIGKRTCTKAQWEIRGIAQQMAHCIKRESPELGKYAVPQGITFGRCPEKEPCGVCSKPNSKNPHDSEQK